MTEGTSITYQDGRIQVPNDPIIPLIRGDGIGPDVADAAVLVVDAAVKKAYGGQRTINWKPVLAGEEAHKQEDEWLPEATLDAIREHHVALKGPLTTPVGGGFRSLNVAIRQILDLYACIRPARHYPGVPSPHVNPDHLNVVIFRENTEDVYSGIEWAAGTPEVAKVQAFLKDEMGVETRENSGIGIKPISEMGTKRLVRAAIQYALDNERRSVTLMHKGNIMKFTEGAFRNWGYEVAQEFGDKVITEEALWEEYDGKAPDGVVVVKDRIADNMMMQLLLRPAEYDVIATMNLNGDYVSDLGAAIVGGLGLAPGANVNDTIGVFEATHGTAPKYAGMNKVNPSSLILSGAMMLEHMGWTEAANLIHDAIGRTITEKVVTYDLARQMEGVEPVGTRQFAEAICERL